MLGEGFEIYILPRRDFKINFVSIFRFQVSGFGCQD